MSAGRISGNWTTGYVIFPAKKKPGRKVWVADVIR